MHVVYYCDGMDVKQMIIELRGKQVILDRDLAELYWVQTKQLKQAVRRNRERFPEDFMFELNENEIITVVSQFVTPSKSYLWWAIPFAFTEHGILMLANVLKSTQALEVSIQIVRYFVHMRNMVMTVDALYQELKHINSHLSEHDELIQQLCFEIEKFRLEEVEQHQRKIWFRTAECN